MKPASYRILAGWLLDGSGQPPASDVLITVSKGTIEELTDAREKCPPAHSQTPLLDLSQWTLIPPLADCHVHLCLSGATDKGVRQFQADASYSELKPAMVNHLKEYRSRGILGIRDGGDCGGYSLRLRIEESRAGAHDLIVRSAGRAWHSKGRYGRLLGRSPDDGDTLKVAISRCSEPSDHLKVINSGMVSMKEFGSTGRSQFDRDQLRDAFEYAHERNRKVMVHANGNEPVSIAVDAGCDTIEHGFFAGRENLIRMRDRGVFWIPTLRAVEALADNLPDGSKGKRIALRTLEHQLEQVSSGADMGVAIAMGTDSGSIGVDHGRAVAQEIRLFLKAGISPEKIVHFASTNGSRILGAESGTHGIIKGRQAKMIALKGTPARALGAYEECEKRFFGFVQQDVIPQAVPPLPCCGLHS